MSVERAAPPKQPTDLDIVDALRRGDEHAAEALYERVHAQVERTLQRLVRFQSAELDDLVQATFERMIRFLSERALTDGSNLPAWASTVAANVALDYLRRKAREQTLFERDVLDSVRSSDASPERCADARLAMSRVQALLARMQPKYAEPVVLHAVLGHDLAEIAAIMGTSIAATQSRLVRGRKDLLRRAKAQR